MAALGSCLVRAALLAGGAVAAPAFAAVLALAPTTRGDSLHVVDVATRNATLLEAPSCCAVQAGSVAADAATHRVYFVSNDSAGAQLYTFAYAAAASVSAQPLSAGVRITHLAWDTGHARLAGFAALDGGGIELVTVAPGSGNVTVTGTLGPDCCTLRAGAIAYAAADGGTLYAVGRRSDDAGDQLLAFSVDGATLLHAYDLGNERVAQLVADGGALYALSYAQDSGLLRPALISFAPAFALQPLGPGAGECCFVLAGPAAIDHAAGTLVTLARTFVSNQFAIRAFLLSNGRMVTGNSMPALGLFEDSAVLFDRIFADSFEPLP